MIAMFRRIRILFAVILISGIVEVLVTMTNTLWLRRTQSEGMKICISKTDKLLQRDSCNNSRVTSGEDISGRGTDMFVKMSETEIYIKFAVRHLKSDNDKQIFDNGGNITVIGWQKREEFTKNQSVVCCLKDTSLEKIVRSVAKVRSVFLKRMSKAFEAMSWECPVQGDVRITDVALTYNGDMCDNLTMRFITVFNFPLSARRIQRLALCAKLAYGQVNPCRLVEWLEAQRFLGVDKIFMYLLDDLNKEAREVFVYYGAKNLVEWFPFSSPYNGTAFANKDKKGIQDFADMQIAVLECEERMRKYQYGMFLDIDEILVPEGMSLQNSLKRYLNASFSNSSYGVLNFMTKHHVVSWGETSVHPLYFGRYLNSTMAFWDRKKSAYDPDRIIPGSCSAHGCVAKKLFSQHYALKDIAIHHFRKCRGNYDLPNNNTEYERLFERDTGNVCNDFKRIKSESLNSLMDSILDKVNEVLSSLSLQTC